jgi:hypothetical protein
MRIIKTGIRKEPNDKAKQVFTLSGRDGSGFDKNCL